jgi:hypothetical protein
VWRLLVLVLVSIGVSFGCVNQAAKAMNPPPEGGGTLSCREIMENCDSACTQPFCLHACTNQGTPEAAQQHDALLQCGQNNSCTDQDCMQANCTPEFETCHGPETESTEPTEPTEAAEPTDPNAPTEPTPPPAE